MTGGIGPDACIDAVGMESHGLSVDNIVDTVKAHTFLGTDRPHALRQAILACRKGGRLSIPGVYGGMADKFPIGALMEKGLTVKSGRPTSRNSRKPLLEMIGEGKIDTTFLISHRASLEDGPEMYRHWHDEQNDYTKIVLKPDMAKGEVKTSVGGPSMRKFAIVTGASSGIGLEIARLAAADGYDLLVAADTPFVDAAAGLKDLGVEVAPDRSATCRPRKASTNCSTPIGGRDVDVLVANAGHGLGGAFLDQEVERLAPRRSTPMSPARCC